MAEPLLTQVRKLLDEERLALVGGQFANLPAIAARKLLLLQGLQGATGAELQELRGMRVAFDHQNLLIEAGLAGVRAAHVRLREIRSAATGIRSYAPDGSSHRIGIPPIRIDRRA